METTDKFARVTQIARVMMRHVRPSLLDQHASGLPDALAPDVDEHPDEVGDPERFVADLEELGPTFVKLGQLLATRADLLPAAHVAALGRLEDQVSPLDADTIVEVIEHELGARLHAVFPEFDREPLAAASLAQVHRAVTRDGVEVAVKVQRPTAREVVREDLELLASLAGWVEQHTEAGEHFQVSQVVAEFRASLATELDYRREAANLVELAENLASFDSLVVPTPIVGLSTDRVLTMQYIPGRKLTELGPLAQLELEGERLVDDLFHAYLRQVLADGFVHADPHPGNVLLTADGRLALIDLGMVVRLRPEMRERLLSLLTSIADADLDEAASAAIAMGEQRPWFDEPAFRTQVGRLLTWYRGVPASEVQLGRVMVEVARISGDTGLRPPQELSLLGRTLLSLDHVAHVLQPDFDGDAAIRRHASSLLTEMMTDQLRPTAMLRGMLETKEFVEQLPQRANRILTNLADGGMRLQVDTIDEDRLHATIRGVGNRLSAGIVVAALVIGASMLLGVDVAGPTLFGYPAMAIVLFLGAVGLGLWLVGSVLLEGRRDRRRRG